MKNIYSFWYLLSPNKLYDVYKSPNVKVAIPQSLEKTCNMQMHNHSYRMLPATSWLRYTENTAAILSEYLKTNFKSRYSQFLEPSDMFLFYLQCWSSEAPLTSLKYTPATCYSIAKQWLSSLKIKWRLWFMKLITFSPHKIRTYNESEKYKIATK